MSEGFRGTRVQPSGPSALNLGTLGSIMGAAISSEGDVISTCSDPGSTPKPETLDP